MESIFEVTRRRVARTADWNSRRLDKIE
jgi:hypothetical protein